MENNNLIKYEGSLINHVANAIAITNRLLAVSERQKIITFLVEYPDFFVGFVSKYYPLNETLLAKYYNIPFSTRYLNNFSNGAAVLNKIVAVFPSY